MPLLDGIETTRIMRTNGIKIPVVGLTANVDEASRQSALAVGMSQFVSKPTKMAVLKSAIHKAISSEH